MSRKKSVLFLLCLLSFLLVLRLRNYYSVHNVINSSSSTEYQVNKDVKSVLSSPLNLDPHASSQTPQKLVYSEDRKECAKSTFSVVVLMRIAKCASTSLVEVVNSLSRRNKFIFVFNRSGAYNWNEQEIKTISELCVRELVRVREMREYGFKELVLYARHLYFTSFQSVDYTYITFVREPISRVVSSYSYYHFSRKPGIRQLIPRKYRGETLLDCVRFNHDGCTSNLMTKYFCGHDKFCSSGSGEAVAKAKENMKRKFIVIGVVEMMKPSMNLLKLRIPDVFEGADDYLPESNIGESHLNITEEEHHMIRIMNFADLEVYHFAIELLHKQLTSCGLLP